MTETSTETPVETQEESAVVAPQEESVPEAPPPPAEDPESNWSASVKSLSVYFDDVVTVHLRILVAMLDLSELGEIYNPQEQQNQLVAILAPATFVRQTQDDPPVLETLPPRATDVLENVVLSAAPCGERIMITQRTQGTHAGDLEAFQKQSGAVLTHMVMPRDIAVITRLGSPPDPSVARRRSEPETSRLVTL